MENYETPVESKTEEECFGKTTQCQNGWLLATDLVKPWPLWTWLQPQWPLSLPLASYIVSDPGGVLSIHNSEKRSGGLRPGCGHLNSNGSFPSQLVRGQSWLTTDSPNDLKRALSRTWWESRPSVYLAYISVTQFLCIQIWMSPKAALYSVSNPTEQGVGVSLLHRVISLPKPLVTGSPIVEPTADSARVIWPSSNLGWLQVRR